jgi:hypothetical protein
MNDASHQRRAVRTAIKQDAVLIDADGNHLPVILLDLSADGFRIESAESFEVGEQVRIRCGKDEPLAGQIRWVAGRQAGGVFLAPPREAV